VIGCRGLGQRQRLQGNGLLPAQHQQPGVKHAALHLIQVHAGRVRGKGQGMAIVARLHLRAQDAQLDVGLVRLQGRLLESLPSAIGITGTQAAFAFVQQAASLGQGLRSAACIVAVPVLMIAMLTLHGMQLPNRHRTRLHRGGRQGTRGRHAQRSGPCSGQAQPTPHHWRVIRGLLSVALAGL